MAGISPAELLGLPPGVPALIVLTLSALAGWKFAAYKVRTLGGLLHLGPLAVDSIAVCIVAGTFWAWASYKLLVHRDPDFGVVSFLIAGCTSIGRHGRRAHYDVLLPSLFVQ